MTNIACTPEALLGRSDSKNPSTTCKGITNSGRPCRRALAVPKKASPSSSRNSDSRNSLASALNGIVKIVEENGEVRAADFYCWQHKDQAEQAADDETARQARKAKGRRSVELFPLRERSSIDTLVQRLGIDTISPGAKERGRKSANGDANPPKRISTIGFADRQSQPSGHVHVGRHQPPSQPQPEEKNKAKNKRSPGFWASLCCATSDQDDYLEIVRHRERVKQTNRRTRAHPTESRAEKGSRDRRQSLPQRASAPAQGPGSRRQTSRHINQAIPSDDAQTGDLLALIPRHCSPRTTSTLLSELIKPINTVDEEGYIYIFWLTPQTREGPAESTAKSLLAPPDRKPEHSRRISDVMTEFSCDSSEEQSTRDLDNASQLGKKVIMLKIGRASNVTRRMNEWQRQCGYKLNLVRWYPYVPSAADSPSPQPSRSRQTHYPDTARASRPSTQSGDVVRKIPYVKKVERLIHLELAEQRVLRHCQKCGKEHREWFAVEASQEGVRNVDACVRRWIEWAESKASM